MTIFRAEFLVDEQGKLSLTTSSDHAVSFERVRQAMLTCRAELDRIIQAGPTTCPFRKHEGSPKQVTVASAIQQIEQIMPSIGEREGVAGLSIEATAAGFDLFCEGRRKSYLIDSLSLDGISKAFSRAVTDFCQARP